MQRLVWKQNRWAPGCTVILGTRESQFEADIRGLGFSPTMLSPATIDAARWVWVAEQAGRVSRDQLRDRIRLHVLKDERAKP